MFGGQLQQAAKNAATVKKNPYAAAKAKDSNLDSYIKTRNTSEKGSQAYVDAQNKINEAYGVSKRHTVTKPDAPQKVDNKPVAPVDNKAVGKNPSIKTLTGPQSATGSAGKSLDAAASTLLKSKYGGVGDVTKKITSGMSLMAGGDGKSSSATGQQFDTKPYQSASTHIDKSGTMITNLEGKPGVARNRSKIGGPSSAHSDARASADKTSDFKSSSFDFDTTVSPSGKALTNSPTDYAAKLAADEGAYNTKMQKQQKRETLASLGSRKEFKQAKKEGILTGKDRKAAKQAIAQTKGDIAFNKSQDAANYQMTVRQAKKKVREGMTPDELGVKGLGYGDKYSRVVGSRAYAKQVAQKEGTSVRKSKKNFIAGFNAANEAANNPGRLKMGIFGKVKRV